MDPNLREYREHIQSEVRNVMRRFVELRMHGDESGRSMDWSGSSVGALPKLSEIACWRLSIDTIISSVDRDLRAKYRLQSPCALYVRREIMGEKWASIAARANRGQDRAKDIVAAVTARLYAEFSVRGITEEIDEAA